MYICNKNLIPLVRHPATETERDDPCPYSHTQFFSISFNIIFSSGFKPSKQSLDFRLSCDQPYVILMAPTRASCFIKLNLSYLRTREMLKEKPTRLRSSSFYSLSHTPVPSSPSGTNILLSAANPKALSSTLRSRTHQ